MKEYKNEEEFLKDYNPKDYDQLSLTADILILSVSDEEQDNYRKNNKKHMSVLLIKRKDYPFKDKWCLPGGFLNIDEELDECPRRILKQETNLQDIYLEQLYTLGGVNRDPRTRIISVSYMALVDKNRLHQSLVENASWFNISYEEHEKYVDITLDNGIEKLNTRVNKELREHTTDRYEFSCDDKTLAFDHSIVILSGIERLKNKVGYTDIVFNMMPEYFTIGDLQQVYEVILNKKLLDPAFRRIIADKVEKTDMMKTGDGHRPSYLFKYKNKR